MYRKRLVNSSTVRINYETICSDFENGGLKNGHIETKILSLQSAWIKKNMYKASITGK